MQAPEQEPREWIRPKPRSFVKIGNLAPEVFEIFKVRYGIGDVLILDFTSIGVAHAEIFDPQKQAAFAMRKLQALYHLAQVEVVAPLDSCVGLVAEVAQAAAAFIRSPPPAAEAAEVETVKMLWKTLRRSGLDLSEICVDLPDHPVFLEEPPSLGDDHT